MLNRLFLDFASGRGSGKLPNLATANCLSLHQRQHSGTNDQWPLKVLQQKILQIIAFFLQSGGDEKAFKITVIITVKFTATRITISTCSLVKKDNKEHKETLFPAG